MPRVVQTRPAVVRPASTADDRDPGLSVGACRVAVVVDVEVRSRIPGVSGDDIPTVLVRLAEERATARELIHRAVEEQIRQLRADASRCRRSLDRQYADLRGPVGAPGSDPDVAVEVSRAVRAFARGTFVIFAGGRQLTDLDVPVRVRLGEPVLFLRPVALVGG